MIEDQETIIGESVILDGNIQGDENIHVHGRVEGSINTKKDLLITESGLVKADIKAKKAVIHGVVVGNIFSMEKVEIGKTGRIVGNITALSLIIEKGAAFKGRIEMPDFYEEKKVPSQKKDNEIKEAIKSGEEPPLDSRVGTPSAPHPEPSTKFPKPPPIISGKRTIIIKKK